MLAGAGTAAYRAGRRREARDQQEADQDQQLSSTSGSEEPSASDEQPASGGGGTVDQLERLKQLLDEGALSQAEYQSAKQRVLSGG